ncbi:MAG TPA: FAD-dependent oxidoreductase [Deltaproteobacteria bacterium]|nr:FAD-dependent oxidoreductase [Deltaproteobacteria bacterium]
MLKPEMYKELEDLLGPENVTQEPSVLDSYAWQPLWNVSGDSWTTRAEAAVLPGSAEECRQIVRICNAYGVRFKAICTGWGSTGACSENTIQIDLRRMDRILEIDEKNLYAVIEPHVCGNQLQAELMKRGLNCHIISAGAASSPLASATSMMGCAPDGTAYGWSSRNLLGVEWIQPNGEMIQVGSPGSGLGWWTAEGPGPGLRGIFRGRFGGMGGNGVFTKCAVKIYHYPGPPKPELDGFLLDTAHPIPKNCRMIMQVFKDRDSMARATGAIAEEGIGQQAMKAGNGSALCIMLPNMVRSKAWKTSTALKEVVSAFNLSFFWFLICNSEEELDFQESVMRHEVQEVGGMQFDMGNGPMAQIYFWTMVVNSIYPYAMRGGGMMITGYAQDDSHYAACDASADTVAIKKKWIAKGACLDDNGDGTCHFFCEENLQSHCEEPWLYDQRVKEQIHMVEPMERDFTAMFLERCQEPSGVILPPARKLFSAMEANFNQYPRAMMERIDPNRVADAYIYCEEADPSTTRMEPEAQAKIAKLVTERAWSGRPEPL